MDSSEDASDRNREVVTDIDGDDMSSDDSAWAIFIELVKTATARAKRGCTYEALETRRMPIVLLSCISNPLLMEPVSSEVKVTF